MKSLLWSPNSIWDWTPKLVLLGNNMCSPETMWHHCKHHCKYHHLLSFLLLVTILFSSYQWRHLKGYWEVHGGANNGFLGTINDIWKPSIDCVKVYLYLQAGHNIEGTSSTLVTIQYSWEDMLEAMILYGYSMWLIGWRQMDIPSIVWYGGCSNLSHPQLVPSLKSGAWVDLVNSGCILIESLAIVSLWFVTTHLASHLLCLGCLSLLLSPLSLCPIDPQYKHQIDWIWICCDDWCTPVVLLDEMYKSTFVGFSWMQLGFPPPPIYWIGMISFWVTICTDQKKDHMYGPIRGWIIQHSWFASWWYTLSKTTSDSLLQLTVFFL